MCASDCRRRSSTPVVQYSSRVDAPRFASPFT